MYNNERPAMIPPQDQVDWNNAEEHLAWALQNMPTFAGIGAVTHTGFLRTWSEHLVKAGVAHVDYLRTLADQDGNIHVSKLPKQTIRWQPAMRGPRHGFNNAARWVSADSPAPQPYRLQDVRTLTDQERQAMVKQLIDVGAIQQDKPAEITAQELN